MVLVAIIAGSRSDEETVKKAGELLEKLGIPYETAYLSAHRNPEDLNEYISRSEAKVFIGIAGLAAHLPGYIASRTNKPVIGVPLDRSLGGLDSLLSMVQMPKGVPVACVGINNAENAALLAAEILGVSDEMIAERVLKYRKGVL